MHSCTTTAEQYRKVDSRWATDNNVRPGDAIIVSGTVGDHGIALLSFREGYGFDTDLKSDVAPLNGLIEEGLKVGGIVAMKDPTRGIGKYELALRESLQICPYQTARSAPRIEPDVRVAVMPGDDVRYLSRELAVTDDPLGHAPFQFGLHVHDITAQAV